MRTLINRPRPTRPPPPKGARDAPPSAQGPSKSKVQAQAERLETVSSREALDRPSLTAPRQQHTPAGAEPHPAQHRRTRRQRRPLARGQQPVRPSESQAVRSPTGRAAKPPAARDVLDLNSLAPNSARTGGHLEVARKPRSAQPRGPPVDGRSGR
ncbi:hypothetical protein T492DRAFT_546152 [Pavlovales sp. CCMP2436]|nr:hypothetical protein T492DRAFT_546152 [Pavlovales sp. CCMP2436]